MDIELQIILSITRNLPRVRGAGVLANFLIKHYCRKPRSLVDTNIKGFSMRLDPHENVDSGLLFYPQLYDYQEISFIGKHLQKGGIFLDIGANVGFYSLVASSIVGNEGLVLSVEADPYTYQKLCFNIRQNDMRNILPLQVGVSDMRQILRLGLNTAGNRGGNSFLPNTNRESIDVACYPLLDLLRINHINQIAGVKIDIEGYEFTVLSNFFTEANYTMYPKFFIVEQHDKNSFLYAGNTIDLLKQKGYEVHQKIKHNYIMVKKTPKKTEVAPQNTVEYPQRS